MKFLKWFTTLSLCLSLSNPAFAGVPQIIQGPPTLSGVGAAASGVNNDITSLLQGAPTTHVFADLNPAIHLANFMANKAPIVCIIGDSTSTLQANNVAPLDLLWSRIQQRLVTNNPIKTISFQNFALGGTVLSQFTQSFVPVNGYPTWWTVPADTWAQAIARVAPNCTSWFINFGVNGPGTINMPIITTVMQAILGYGVPTDIVLITNGIVNPANGVSGTYPYQSGYRANAGFLRSFAHNSQFAGIAGLPPVGLIDLNRVEAQTLYGEDAVNQTLTIDATVTGASISTFPRSFNQSAGDFDLQITLADVTGLVASGAFLKVTLGDLNGADGLQGNSGSNFVVIRSTDGSNCYMNYYGGNQASFNSSITTGWPASGPLSFRITAKQDHIQLTCGATIVADFFAPRVVGPYLPTIAFTGVPPAETITVQQYAPGTPRKTVTLVSQNTFWGSPGGPTGGNGINHASSVGLNLVYAQATEGVDFRATLPVAPAATGLVAVGTTQATALKLASTSNQLSSCPAATGALLWGNGVVGLREIIKNGDVLACLIYPPVGGAINLGATNAAYSLAAGASVEFISFSGTFWIANPLAGAGPPATKIITLTVGATYNPSVGLVYADVYLIGAGGGGGGGARQAASAACSGGGGGGGGGRSFKRWTAAQFGAGVNISIGASGTGGIGAVTDSTAGSVGGNGTSSQMGALQIASGGFGGAGSQLASNSGGGGGGGKGIGGAAAGTNLAGGQGAMTPAGDGGFGVTSVASSNYDGLGGGGGGSGNGTGGAGGAASNAGGASAGGAGAGISAANAVFGGGAGGFALTGVAVFSRGLAGAAGVSGGNGQAALDIGGAGSGGGGGGSSLTVAGNGGLGGLGGGGGGGAGCVQNTNAAATGGTGGAGLAAIIENF